MTTPRTRPQRPTPTLLALCAVLVCTSALAATQGASADALARYQQERAVCTSGQSNQDRATCLREAGAALADAQRSQPVDAAAYTANAGKRCERLPDLERKDCIARMQGQGTTNGSVAAGGLSHELVTREPASPVAANAASGAASVPGK